MCSGNGKVADSKNHDKQTEAIRALNQQLFTDKRVTISLFTYRRWSYLIKEAITLITLVHG